MRWIRGIDVGTFLESHDRSPSLFLGGDWFLKELAKLSYWFLRISFLPGWKFVKSR